MSPINLRAWDAEKKEMHYWTLNDLLCRFGNKEYADDYTASPFFDWMLDTGLKDKNGKKIYGGDIIKFTEVDEGSCFGSEDTEIVEVKWIEDIAQFRAVFKSGRRTELHFVVQLPTVVSCEIIGNIYEHPNLLTTS